MYNVNSVYLLFFKSMLKRHDAVNYLTNNGLVKEFGISICEIVIFFCFQSCFRTRSIFVPHNS